MSEPNVLPVYSPLDMSSKHSPSENEHYEFEEEGVRTPTSSQEQNRMNMIPRFVIGLSLIIFIIFVVYVFNGFVLAFGPHLSSRNVSKFPKTLAKRIAFSSCTAYDLRPLPIFEKIQQKNPDVFIWAGTYTQLHFTDYYLILSIIAN